MHTAVPARTPVPPRPWARPGPAHRSGQPALQDQARRRADGPPARAPGISEPMPVAAALAGGGDAAPYALDTLATVVDGPRFLADVAEARALDEADTGVEDVDGRTLADLLVEQARPRRGRGAHAA